uniref:Amine oxidase n=1 Tax=Chlamydomonas chlamydogama TaxID=225041 RepID=A0A6T5TPM3_9CHLO|mmetsp:Transcript_589/g.1334  ORF Transcript_589/g.1334 Transcript_589/m.1334 type:complete len:770 (+) Transcript_589:183-2492(+)|eukprot:CAMPEP_0202900508 /NCGR_PEP_ID=MMETSP1392-20130828/11872_1 /ASSEMBLY_ACC=CAM_ASM_000868 /TAXON_ID=225041 /ORGANISM="Chlamydomonas chlamydogama, Strain SAG 11-48b" /LENGTH=769 /DNA_ID=CAMNT_0049586909 /DNA_START=156 /DNA_END=2465 /DNA_ORIENTATION=+
MGRALALVLFAACFAVSYAKNCPVYNKGQGPTADRRQAPKERSIFDELNDKEIVAVRDFLLKQSELGLVPYANATANDSVIYTMELLPPPKAEALAFLDAKGPKPQRRAVALLFLLGASTPQLMQVEVGPLPKPTYYKELKFPHQLQDKINIHQRPGSGPELAVWEELVVATMTELEDMLKAELGGYHYVDCTDKCLWYTDSAPRGMDNRQRATWIWFVRYLPGLYAHPVGLEFLVNTTGTDVSKWHISKIFFGNRLWDTAEELLQYYRDNNNTLPGFKVHTPDEAEASYSSMDLTPEEVENGRPTNKRWGPITYEPYGKRYFISGNHISYMGWELDVGVRTSSGVRAWDMRFKGQRQVYEWSMQQAYASYGFGSSMYQRSTHYLDHSWGMGPSHHELVHGVDCPLTASYLDQWHHWDSDAPFKLPNSICIFEQNTNSPYRRHYDKDFEGSYRFYAGVPTYQLVIRSISAVYNYDYLFDIILYMDGTMEQKMVAYGYPQAVRYNDDGSDSKYGYKFFYDVGGSVHDHIIQWKVDIEVNGTSNSVQLDEVKVEKVDYPFNPLVPSGYQKYVHRRLLDNETEALLNVDAKRPTHHIIVNEDSKNSWGSLRGMLVQVIRPFYQLLPDDFEGWMPSNWWTKQQIAVSVRKDEESMSGSILEQASSLDPVMDFRKFFDGESIRKKDLVLWINVGHQHIPVAEDAPNTPSGASYDGFSLRPYNLHDKDTSTDLLETTYITKDENGTQIRKSYGMPRDSTGKCIPTFANVKWDGNY